MGQRLLDIGKETSPTQHRPDKQIKAKFGPPYFPSTPMNGGMMVFEKH